MPRFYEFAEKEISTFGGLYFAHHNMDEAYSTLKQGRTVILGMETMLLGALTHGFEAVAVTMMNIHPELIFEIFENCRNNKLQEAKTTQYKLNQRINEIYKRGGDWNTYMKNEFNKVRDFKVGPTRKPMYNVKNYQY